MDMKKATFGKRRPLTIACHMKSVNAPLVKSKVPWQQSPEGIDFFVLQDKNPAGGLFLLGSVSGHLAGSRINLLGSVLGHLAGGINLGSRVLCCSGITGLSFRTFRITSGCESNDGESEQYFFHHDEFKMCTNDLTLIPDVKKGNPTSEEN
jgi:hypothetical protein